MPQINELVIAFRKLVDNNRAVNITNINSILTSFGMFSYLKEQFDKNVYAPVIVSNLQSYYSNKFKDGTHIKFIGDLSTKNEEDGITKLGLMKHKTPGVK